MQVNKIDVETVIGWFKAALDAGARRPGPVFGAALLQLLFWSVLMLGLVVLLAVLATASTGGSQDEAVIRQAIAGWLLPAFLAFMLLGAVLGPILGGGLLQALDNADTGAPVSALDAFAGFRGRVLFPLAGLAVLGLGGFGLNLLGQWLFGGSEYLAGQFGVWEQIATGNITPPPPPQMPVANFVWSLLVGVVNGLVSVLAVPLVQLGGLGTFGAIIAAFRALRTNPGPLLLAAVIGFAAIMGLALVAAVVFALVALLAAVLPLLALPLGLLLMLALAVVFLVLYYAFCRAAWRSLFTDAAQAPPPLPGQIAA